MANTTCIINAYFGTLPNYFPLWLRSATANSDFDWLLVTDCDTSSFAPFPENFRVLKISFVSLRERAQELFSFPISLERPYKLCDYKPLYGLLFEQELEGYEWWGHCDLDVVWGDLRHFFPSHIFAGADRIQETGHLIFYRNAPEVNNSFKTPGAGVDYREVFSRPGSFAFDEWGGMHNISYVARLRSRWVRAYFDARPDIFQLRLGHQRNFPHQMLYWEDGHLYREYVLPTESSDRNYLYPKTERDEFMYVHLMKRPMKPVGTELLSLPYRGFYIEPDRFVPKIKREHWLGDFHLHNPSRPARLLKPRLRTVASQWRHRLKWLLNSLC